LELGHKNPGKNFFGQKKNHHQKVKKINPISTGQKKNKKTKKQKKKQKHKNK